MSTLRWTQEQFTAYATQLQKLRTAKPKPIKLPKGRSPLEITLETQLVAAAIPFVREYKPLSDRKFRIDFAIPSKMIGIECEGAVHRIKGRWKQFHERHAVLTLEGWTMLYVGRDEIKSGQAIEWVRALNDRHN